MSLADQIIERLDNGEKPQLVAGQYTWNSIPPPERRKLTIEAERRSVQTEKSAALLWALYYLTQKADRWEFLNALALIVRRPDFDFDRRKKGLEYIWQILEGIRSSLGQHDSQAIRQYKLYEADYYALSANVLQEGGSGASLPQVIQLYQDAQQIWHKYGESKRVEWAEAQIQTLQSMVQRGETLLPIDLLRSERSTLQAEIEELRRKEKKLQEALAAGRESEQGITARITQLAGEAQTAEAELKRLQDGLEPSREALRKLQARIHEHEAALHFLTALPRAATVPLWVEVVRLALDQGEMDDLTQQAIERLILVCPEEVLPLLAEVAARAPEPFQSTPEQFKDTAAGWMAGIAEARTLQGKDARAAAQRLVDSWATFFDEVSESDSNA